MKKPREPKITFKYIEAKNSTEKEEFERNVDIVYNRLFDKAFKNIVLSRKKGKV